MAKPKKAFSVNMGGNSSADDIAKYQEELEAAKPRQKKELAAPQPRDVPPDQPPLPLEGVAAYDFRMLKEPEKTLQRVQALLSDPRLTHGERAAYHRREDPRSLPGYQSRRRRSSCHPV